MSRSSAVSTLSYLGWSGFDLRLPGAPPVLFDPPGDDAIPRHEDICLVITHGHPEHIAGTAAYLRDKTREGGAQVFASPIVCRALKHRSAKAKDKFYACQPGQTYRAGPITVDVFACNHMTLLPPEKGEGLKRLRQIAGNFRLAAEIAANVIRFPVAGPTLGFRLSGKIGPSILFYGEGLHRCAGREKIAAVARKLPSEVLIAAVEPEDLEMMPQLVSDSGASTIVPYEAHAPWRKGFGMPCADLDVLRSTLHSQGYETLRADPNEPVRIPQ